MAAAPRDLTHSREIIQAIQTYPTKAIGQKLLSPSSLPSHLSFQRFRYRGPWKMIYYEAYFNRQDAEGRERYLKSGGGRRFLSAAQALF